MSDEIDPLALALFGIRDHIRCHFGCADKRGIGGHHFDADDECALADIVRRYGDQRAAAPEPGLREDQAPQMAAEEEDDMSEQRGGEIGAWGREEPHTLTEYGTTNCPAEGVRAEVDSDGCSACGGPVTSPDLPATPPQPANADETGAGDA